MQIPQLLEEGKNYKYLIGTTGLKLIYQNVRRKRGQTVEYFDYLTRYLGIFHALEVMAYKPHLMYGYKSAIIGKLNYLARLVNSDKIVAVTIPSQEQAENTDRCYEFVNLAKYENLLFLETACPLKKADLQQLAPNTLKIDSIYWFSEIAEENLMNALEHFYQDSTEINNSFKSQLAAFFIDILKSGELSVAINEAISRLDKTLLSLSSYS